MNRRLTGFEGSRGSMSVLQYARYISLLDDLRGEAYRDFLWEELTPRGNVVHQEAER